MIKKKVIKKNLLKIKDCLHGIYNYIPIELAGDLSEICNHAAALYKILRIYFFGHWIPTIVILTLLKQIS